MVTNLLWLRKPIETPELPMQIVFAQSYVLRGDDTKLWDTFLQNLEKMKEKGDLVQQ